MAVQLSVVGFEYSAEPTEKTWTRRFAAVAFAPGYEDTIKQLSTLASELVGEHDVCLNTFSDHGTRRIAVKRKGDGLDLVSVGEFGGAFQIAGIPSFVVHLCRRRAHSSSQFR